MATITVTGLMTEEEIGTIDIDEESGEVTTKPAKGVQELGAELLDSIAQDLSDEGENAWYRWEQKVGLTWA